MKSLKSRLEQLEHRTGVDKPPPFVILLRAGHNLALDMDRCIEILEECGFAVRGGMSMLNFLGIPYCLNAVQLERHLREHASEICGGRQPGGRSE